MIKIIRLLPVLLSTLLPLTAVAVDGVECELSVYQYDQEGDQDILLWSDTTHVVDSLAASGFLVAFSVDLEFTLIDSADCSFNVHVVTFSNPINNYSRSFRTEYGLPARLDGIIGKEGAAYSLIVRPLEREEIDTTTCAINHLNPDHFRADPSGYMDIYYAPNSYGDFYWNVVKGILEERYRLFMNINDFTMPGKYLVYLCPCPMYSVLWDNRFGVSVDPTRNVVFTIYNRNLNTADPFNVLHASVYRNYGYAPAFFSEGLAGYLSLSVYEMKRLVKDGQNVPLTSLLDTYAYYEANPNLADKTASTFVKYLVNQYQISRFLEAYRQADDLNLQTVLERVYGKTIGELEQEWLTYVDTVSITAEQYRLYADLAEAMFDYRLMMTYSAELLPLAENRGDTLASLERQARAAFSDGDYYTATDMQKKIVVLRDDNSFDWMALAGYQMMNGLYDEASANLERAAAIDSTNQTVQFNQALAALARDDEKTAIQLLSGIILKPEPQGPQAESRALLGNLLAGSDNEADRSQGLQYSREALSALASVINSGATSALYHMWSGIAYLGMGDTGNAEDMLESALLLEKRPFYVGMIALWLGKTADIRGEHDVARDFYAYVLSIASADYHQNEARRYMAEPYRR